MSDVSWSAILACFCINNHAVFDCCVCERVEAVNEFALHKGAIETLFM
jgi:hypothetical protein